MARNMIAARRRETAAVGLAVALAVLLAPLKASGGEGVVIDWRTGLALHGFDPVAYFVDRQPAAGRAEIELTHGGAVWRFRNEGNRTVFARHPQTYAPRFGGHDPVAVARGVATPGNPLIWLVHERRLYLFHDAQARDLFAADPAAMLARASERWAALAPTL